MGGGMRDSMLSYSVKVLVWGVLISGVFGIVSLRSEIRHVEYELGALQRELGGVLKERKDLMAERAALLSIHTVEQRAEEDMGLSFPDRTKVFYVKRDMGDVPYEASFTKK
jgi:cell division protein FtsL